MKIAFLFGSMGRGGAERMISHLANNWVKKGDKVAIITLDDSDPGYQLSASVELRKLGVSSISKNKLQAVRRNYNTIISLRNLVVSEKYDVIISFQMRSAIQLVLAKPLFRKYKIVASERANPKFDDIGLIEKVIRKLLLRKIDGFIFQTSAARECYPHAIKSKSTIIPNGVFNDVLRDPVEFEKRDWKKICAVGRLSEQKGFDTLIDSFKLFCDKKKGYSLNIYGDGQLRNSLQDKVDGYNLSDSVFFHGNIPNVIEQISNAGMFVLSSRFEGMPNALMEAMAMGLPCISTNCEFGPNELIENEVNGILVNVDDSIELSEAMEKVTNDRSFAMELSAASIRIRETHSGDVISNMYYEYLLGICE